MSLVLYDVAQLVGEMAVLVVLDRTDLGSHSVLGSSGSASSKIVRLLVVRLSPGPGVGSEGSTPPLAVPSSS